MSNEKVFVTDSDMSDIDIRGLFGMRSDPIPFSRKTYFPSISCIYFVLDVNGSVQYVGETSNLRKRFLSRTEENEFKGRSLFVSWVAVEDDKPKRVSLEKKFIELFDPPFNKRDKEIYSWTKSKAAYGVYIGRFSPFHNGHLESMLDYIEKVNHLIIMVGSTNRARDIKNPFNFEEREMMIIESLRAKGILVGQFTIVPIPDSYYGETFWNMRVVQELSKIVHDSEDVTLFGHNKDDTSYYLSTFQNIRHVSLSKLKANGINATDIRKYMFEGSADLEAYLKEHTPEAVSSFLLDFVDSEEGQGLRAEYEYIQKYKAESQHGKYPIQFITVDALVLKAGHVLLVERGGLPGKGLYALPGGFLQDNEDILTGTIRELKEETSLAILPEILRDAVKHTRVFDYPKRSLRGRVVSHTSLIDLNTRGAGLPRVRGADDASSAFWLPLNEINKHPEMFFEDHYDIIQTMLEMWRY